MVQYIAVVVGDVPYTIDPCYFMRFFPFIHNLIANPFFVLVYGMVILCCTCSVGSHVLDAARNNFIANFNIPSVYGMFIPGCTRSVGIYVPDAAPNVLIANFFEVSV